MNKEPSVILISNSSKEAILLAQKMSESNFLKAIVVERKKTNHASFLYKTATALFKAKTLEYLLILIKPKKIRKILFKEFRLKQQSSNIFFKKHTNLILPEVDIFESESCNNIESITFIKRHNPDLIFIWGTGIIKKNVIQLAKYIVNCHFSKLPYFKGAFSEFWIFYFGDFEKAGITFHLVNEKIDSGKIIKFVHNTCQSNPFEMRYTNIELLLKNVNPIIKNILVNNKNIFVVQQPLKGKHSFRFSDITQEHKSKVYLNN